MENREQPSTQIPINYDSDNDVSSTAEADRSSIDSADSLASEANLANEAVSASAVTDEPEEVEVAAETTPVPEAIRITDTEISQMLIDLSDAQERAAKLTEEKKVIYEQLVRRQAEFENFRKRVDRERTETHARARADIVTELLPVLDNLERALDSGSTAEAGEGLQEGILAGVKLIHRQFLDVLLGLGLSPVKAVGEPFDPHMHEAVTTQATNDLPENTVVAELQRGYKLGERLLRPAMVKVAVRE